MASASAAHIILFIASIVVAAGVAGTVVLEVGELSDAIEMQGSATSEEIQTEVDVISDEGHQSALYDNESEQVTLYVKNIGSKPLEAHHSAVDVLVNGQYISSTQTSVEHVDRETSSWRVGDVVELTVDLSTNDDIQLEGDTSVSVIVNDNEEQIDFYVG